MPLSDLRCVEKCSISVTFFIGTLTGLFFNPETSISEVFFDDSIISGTPRCFSKTTGEKVFYNYGMVTVNIVVMDRLLLLHKRYGHLVNIMLRNI